MFQTLLAQLVRVVDYCNKFTIHLNKQRVFIPLLPTYVKWIATPLDRKLGDYITKNINETEIKLAKHCKGVYILKKQAEEKGDTDTARIMSREQERLRRIFIQFGIDNISMKGEITTPNT